MKQQTMTKSVTNASCTFQNESPLIQVKTLGNSWRDSLNNSVNKKWLSDDARDDFEQKRYRRELASFLARPENQTRTQSPDLEQVFQEEYQNN